MHWQMLMSSHNSKRSSQVVWWRTTPRLGARCARCNSWRFHHFGLFSNIGGHSVEVSAYP
jgi:hypothetical protein